MAMLSSPISLHWNPRELSQASLLPVTILSAVSPSVYSYLVDLWRQDDLNSLTFP